MRNRKEWNYRVLKIPNPKVEGYDKTFSVGIHDVYYENGKPTSWGEVPQFPIGENWNELFEDFCLFEKAFFEPMLELKKGKLVEVHNRFAK